MVKPVNFRGLEKILCEKMNKGKDKEKEKEKNLTKEEEEMRRMDAYVI